MLLLTIMGTNSMNIIFHFSILNSLGGLIDGQVSQDLEALVSHPNIQEMRISAGDLIAC